MSFNNDNFNTSSTGAGRTDQFGSQTGAGRTHQEFAGNNDSGFSTGTGRLEDPNNTQGFVDEHRSGRSNLDDHTFGGNTAQQFDAPLGTTTVGRNFDAPHGSAGHTTGRGAGGDFDSSARPSGMGQAPTAGPGSGVTAGHYGSTGIRDSTDTDRFGSTGATTGSHTAGSHTVGSHAGTYDSTNKPGIGDKIVGGAQEMLGKAKKDPALVEKGQERKLGGNTETNY